MQVHVIPAAPSSKITSLGRAMACFPVSPRYGKMLSMGHQHDLLPYVVAVVAALSVQELFVGAHSAKPDSEEVRTVMNAVVLLHLHANVAFGF